MRLDDGTYTQAKTIQSQAGAQDWIEYSPGDKILPSAVAYGRKCMFRLMDDSEVELCLYSGTTLPVVTKAIRFPDDVTDGEMITVMDGAEVAQHMRPTEIFSSTLYQTTSNVTLDSTQQIVTKTGGTPWQEQIYSTIGYKDGAYVSFKPVNYDSAVMFSLNETQGPTSHTETDSVSYTHLRAHETREDLG